MKFKKGSGSRSGVSLVDVKVQAICSLKPNHTVDDEDPEKDC